MPRARRAEIWIADLGMAAKIRPVVILSVAYEENERAIVSYVPRTTTVRGSRFEVAHRPANMPVGAFDAQGIGSMPDVKLERRIGVLDDAVMKAVDLAVRQWLGL